MADKQKTGIMTKTKIDTNHMSDIWRLPVVIKAYKTQGRTVVVFEYDTQRLLLTDGDSIIQGDNGEWWTEMTTESQKLNRCKITSRF